LKNREDKLGKAKDKVLDRQINKILIAVEIVIPDLRDPVDKIKEIITLMDSLTNC
jgi:hypothetical protein